MALRLAIRILPLFVLVAAPPGCTLPDRLPSAADRGIDADLKPLLSLDPDAEWTSCFNRLLADPARAIDRINRRPAMQTRSAPDSLETLLHTSLIRLLAGPDTPRLTFTCFETSLDLLHFDPKSAGRPLGEVCIPPNTPIRSWADLYPQRVDHALAAQVDAEADRRAIRKWWAEASIRPLRFPVRRLQPHGDNLWPLLERRYADLWLYEVERRPVLVSDEHRGHTAVALLQVPSSDYNLVRAAAIWLGKNASFDEQQQLIELVADPRPIVSHNAVFALRFCPDPRIRDAIERYNRGTTPVAWRSARN
ncbi:MAG: hypothetical protein HZB38_16275 [Planctomycetes bacterium]|nr:hypothetical protein [Planctomycetota bacterium]